MAKCGHCGNNIISLRYRAMDATESFGTGSWKAVALCCPSCDVVLSAQFDPIAIKTDIVNQVLRGLGRR